MSYRLGIDVGGTFTDFLLLGDDTQLVHKTSSTPDDPSRGFVHGLEEIAGRLGVDFGDFMASIELIVHGTTVSTNAVLTDSGALTGALMTEGFRDTLRLRDGLRATPYDNHLTPPRPLAARERTYGIRERIGPEGQVHIELDEQSVRDAAGALRADGVEAVAISFLHSPQKRRTSAGRWRSSPRSCRTRTSRRPVSCCRRSATTRARARPCSTATSGRSSAGTWPR